MATGQHNSTSIPKRARSIVATNIDYYQVKTKLLRSDFYLSHSFILIFFLLVSLVRLLNDSNRSQISIWLLELTENNSCQNGWMNGKTIPFVDKMRFEWFAITILNLAQVKQTNVIFLHFIIISWNKNISNVMAFNQCQKKKNTEASETRRNKKMISVSWIASIHKIWHERN